MKETWQHASQIFLFPSESFLKKVFHQDGEDWRMFVYPFHGEMMSEMWIVWMRNAEMCCVHSLSLPLILQEMISLLYLAI